MNSENKRQDKEKKEALQAEVNPTQMSNYSHTIKIEYTPSEAQKLINAHRGRR